MLCQMYAVCQQGANVCLWARTCWFSTRSFGCMTVCAMGVYILIVLLSIELLGELLVVDVAQSTQEWVEADVVQALRMTR